MKVWNLKQLNNVSVNRKLVCRWRYIEGHKVDSWFSLNDYNKVKKSFPIFYYHQNTIDDKLVISLLAITIVMLIYGFFRFRSWHTTLHWQGNSMYDIPHGLSENCNNNNNLTVHLTIHSIIHLIMSVWLLKWKKWNKFKRWDHKIQGKFITLLLDQQYHEQRK